MDVFQAANSLDKDVQVSAKIIDDPFARGTIEGFTLKVAQEPFVLTRVRMDAQDVKEMNGETRKWVLCFLFVSCYIVFRQCFGGIEILRRNGDHQ